MLGNEWLNNATIPRAEAPYKMDSRTKSRIEKMIVAAQWKTPICHITVIPHEDQTPDFCRYRDLEDNPLKSLYAKYHKLVLRERLLELLKKARDTKVRPDNEVKGAA